MIIKIADYTDLEEILELQQLAFQKEASEYNDYAIEPLTQTIDDLKEDYKKCLFVKATNAQNAIIGSARGQQKNDTTYVRTVVVHPGWQGQGIGTQLIKTIEKWYRSSRYEINARFVVQKTSGYMSI